MIDYGPSLQEQVKELSKRLGFLGEAFEKKVMKRAVGRGLTRICDGIKGKIPESYSFARDLIGKRFGKRRRMKGVVEAKTGVAVGMRKKRAAEFKEALQTKRKIRHGFRRMGGQKVNTGVGISTSNIHWLILGTKRRTNKKGQNRGSGPPVLNEVVEKGFASSKGEALSDMRKTVESAIKRELKQVLGTWSVKTGRRK